MSGWKRVMIDMRYRYLRMEHSEMKPLREDGTAVNQSRTKRLHIGSELNEGRTGCDIRRGKKSH